MRVRFAQVWPQREGLSALGLEVLVLVIQVKVPAELFVSTALNDMSNKWSLHSRQGVCPHGTLDEVQSNPEDLTHTCPSPCPLYPSIPISSPQCPITAHSH